MTPARPQPAHRGEGAPQGDRKTRQNKGCRIGAILTRVSLSTSIGTPRFSLHTLGSAAPLIDEKEMHLPIRVLQSARHNRSSCLHGSGLLVPDRNAPRHDG